MNMMRRTPQGLKENYEDDLKKKINPILERIQKYYTETKNEMNNYYHDPELVNKLNPKNKIFLTGKLPSVADFELAYLIDHFKWICSKYRVNSPFKNSDLNEIYTSVKELHGVSEYIQ